MADRPGVLAQVATAFAEHGVSIETVRQRIVRDDETGEARANLVVVAHTWRRLALRDRRRPGPAADRRRGHLGDARRLLMAHLGRRIREEAARLPMLDGAPVVTLQEGGTPLISPSTSPS